MRRNCNLELRLVPPSPFIFSDHHHGQQNTREEQHRAGGGESKEKLKQEQQLTIFYDGKVSVCDVTELQARTIIKLASDEIEEKWRRTPGSTTSSDQQYSPLVSPALGNQTGLSMKRSLQRFLQKRKNRIQATSPYQH
uniref:protein TIFY 5A n=1 Tax=Erigeron canadensis TaxID=72917 RepID=UPI001CB8DEE4|nr:protein TIFY 5A [Erigeron canadensis]